MIGTDENNRVTAVRSLDTSRAVHRATGRVFVLACNSLETPWLLLLAASERNPRGIGTHPTARTIRKPGKLSTAHIAPAATISTYVMRQFGNAYAVVSAADVALIRQGGPPLPLLIASRYAMPAAASAAIVILALLAFVLRGGLHSASRTRG
jgi:hypothetical protein